MLAGSRRLLWLSLLLTLGVVGTVYGGTYLSIVEKWYGDTTFSHGFLIVPISLWLAWAKRDELRAVTLKPAWSGVVVLFGAALVWIVARGAGILVIEQTAAVLILIAAVWAVLGTAAARVLMFPLAFLLFVVPFGRGLIPLFMQFTADVATKVLQWTGIPVLRSHMYISIPGGNFEVARACGGLSFAITGIVLGTLYAYLTYQSWFKRAICVLAFLIVPIFANGIRVYITILISHLTDMRYGPGPEHGNFGRVLFVLVMLAMFWIGRRWQDPKPTTTAKAGHPVESNAPISMFTWLAVPAASVIALLAPAYLSHATSQATTRLNSVESIVKLPAGAASWTGPLADEKAWRPLYTGGIVERLGAYRNAKQQQVDVFVAVYGLGSSQGAEMISFKNVLFEAEHVSLADSRSHIVLAGSHGPIKLREVKVPESDGTRLVWTWFVVGDRALTSDFAVKALEAAAFITRNAYSERVITISTPFDDGAQDRLQAFVTAHADCVAAGFAGEACGE